MIKKNGRDHQMRRSTLTIYLPKETFEQAKIAAVRAGISFSGLAHGCVLALINEKTFDRQLPKPSNDEKTMIYLAESEKRKIKIFAASQATTISQLFYQALEHYMTEKIELQPVSKKPAEKKGRPKPDQPVKKKKKPYTYHLTKANNKKLRTISASTGKNRTQLIFDAIENADEKDILKIDLLQPLSERSSMNLTREKLLFLRKKANRLNLSIFELINRAISLYY